MRYWWVNQNQTFEQEFRGGYLWSPKRNSNGARNPFYESMREVAPGDLILSYQGTYIRALGIARTHCYEAPKPAEFGTRGAYWDKTGWRVDVHYIQLGNQVRPKDYMPLIAPVLPDKYAPLRSTGEGKQNLYLTRVEPALMRVLSGLIGSELQHLMTSTQDVDIWTPGSATGQQEWEEHITQELQSNPGISETDKLALVLARRGQGRFKESVRKIERYCRITKVDRIEHLVASHCKPWRDSNNEERLDGENGLLLTPTVDHLFDRGFISFEDDGRMLVSPVAHRPSLKKMGIPVDENLNGGSFTEGQRKYLDFHRSEVFLETGR
ncbi:HNH endonuclease [Thiohalomonas denitrificans]|uniref:HNH endonuclease n=1 Tax=Thiohalomonas denitrificans TaxID=415747 RepID=A0A1G5QKP5_9GAMM|nr:HNH endonuclease signature motif containing protein [Thiohalomonas denitrificans]SCZ62394.1 HNH endonuclease [Thiohalomonas denitrificans]